MDPKKDLAITESQRQRVEGNSLIGGGLSIGAIGLIGAAAGAVCPVCVVATPALLVAGVYKRLRASSASRESTVDES